MEKETVLVFLAAFYLVISLITFIVYAIDKPASKKSTQRTPEKTLHLLALVGGWPGAMLAQKFLRHKTQKQSFRAVFWVTVVLNVAAFMSYVVATG